MPNLVKSESYGVDKHILIANNSYMVTLPAVVANTGVDAGSDGRKVIKAGTPLYGNIEKRDTAFTVSGDTPVAVVLHDVDVTAGNNNATIVLAGVVDLLKLEDSVKTAISSVKSSLPRIIFVEGSAI